MAEDLIAVVRNTKHEKVALLSAAARALRDHLDKPISQFQGYFLALFSDQDYSKVLDSIAKVDKSLRAAIPSKVCSISAGIQCKGQFSPITEASIFLFVCCEFALETSSLSKSNPLYFFANKWLVFTLSLVSLHSLVLLSSPLSHPPLWFGSFIGEPVPSRITEA